VTPAAFATLLLLFGKMLVELHVTHPRTGQLALDERRDRVAGDLWTDPPDRDICPSPEAVDEGRTRFALYHDHQRLIARSAVAPRERWDGTPFTDGVRVHHLRSNVRGVAR
jgi:hypothetical protein